VNHQRDMILYRKLLEMSSVIETRPKIIMVCGPTAIGKTSVAIQMAEKLVGEIVSADSMQIYRYMDIGTAKPTAEERRRVIHHMIDIVDPDAIYDAARFSRESRASINGIIERGRLPIVAGGSGFYIKALLHGLCEAAPEDMAVRERLTAAARQGECGNLHKRLEACDPQAAQNIHPNDAYRIIRALEVFEAIGMTMTQFRKRHAFADAPYDVLKIGLFMDRQALYERIERRVDVMIEEGLFDEVRHLLAMGYHERLRPMQALGYRHMSSFIRGDETWEKAVEALKRDTRRYAKRQLTWFRKDSEINWFDPGDIKGIIACATGFLS
jgi:tRNA dimethylallyltransferase